MQGFVAFCVFCGNLFFVFISVVYRNITLRKIELVIKMYNITQKILKIAGLLKTENVLELI